MPQISRNWNVTPFTHPLPVSVTQPNSLITWGWGFSFFIKSSSDRRSFLSEAGAFAKKNSNGRSSGKKFSIFYHYFYYCGNRFNAVSFLRCSLSAWSFLLCLYRNHWTERDVLLSIVYWPTFGLNLSQIPFFSHSTLNYTTPLSIFTATVKLSWLPRKLFTVALATCEKAPLPMTVIMLTCLRLISQLLVDGCSGM